MIENILNINNRRDFREWLILHAKDKNECYLLLKRGKPLNGSYFYYLDAVEEALCFGWIDSKLCDINGKKYQRFSPRKPNSQWSELNLERVKRLNKIGLMTKAGLDALPIKIAFKANPKILKDLEKATVLEQFKKLPELYQRIRLSNLQSALHRSTKEYRKMLIHTIAKTKENKTFGEWNDYGRLLDY